MTWLVLTGCYGGLTLIGLALSFPGPQKQDKKLGLKVITDGNMSTDAGYYQNVNPSSSHEFADESMNLRDDLDKLEVVRDEQSKVRMVFSQQFIIIYIMNMLSVITGFFTVNNFKTFAQKNDIKDEDYLAWVGSAAAICNSIRFVWSFATDHFSYKSVYTILLVMQIALCFTMQLIDDNKALFAIWVSLLLLCEGGHFTVMPNVLKKIYGKEYGTALYGIAFSFSGICSILIVILQWQLLNEDP